MREHAGGRPGDRAAGEFGAWVGSGRERGRVSNLRARLFAMPLPTHVNPQSLHGNKGEAAKKNRVAGISAAFFYGFMSVASVFLNKAIFEVWRYRYPAASSRDRRYSPSSPSRCSATSASSRSKFNSAHFKRVFVVSAVFQLKLVLDMSALVLVNIPMYGISEAPPLRDAPRLSHQRQSAH